MPQLHVRGERCIPNIRKRARGAKKEAPQNKAKKPAKRRAKPARRILPKGKRLRSDQVRRARPPPNAR